MKAILVGLFLFAAIPASAEYSSGNYLFKSGGTLTGPVQFGAAGVAFSSAPVTCLGGGSTLAGSLASGTTFFVTPPIRSAVVLTGVSFTVAVAGVAGSGDSIICGDSGTNYLSVTVGAAATAGTFASAEGAKSIVYGNQIQCYIASGAATRPIGNVGICYRLQ